MSIAYRRTRRRQQSGAAPNLRGTLCLPNSGRAMRRRLTTRNSRTAEDRRSEPRLRIHASPALDGRTPSVRRASAADSCGWYRWRAEKVAPLSRHSRRWPLYVGSEKKHPAATRQTPLSFVVVDAGVTQILRSTPNARVGTSMAGHVDRGVESWPQQAIPAT